MIVVILPLPMLDFKWRLCSVAHHDCADPAGRFAGASPPRRESRVGVSHERVALTSIQPDCFGSVVYWVAHNLTDLGKTPAFQGRAGTV
jgi:hypothetical protein